MAAHRSRRAKRQSPPPAPPAAGGARPHRKPVNFASFLTRQVFLFALVTFVILTVDFGMTICISLYETALENDSYRPNTAAATVGQDIQLVEDGTWEVPAKDLDMLEELTEGSWAMLIGPEGEIAWSWELPGELAHPYTDQDMMAIAHYNSLDRFPTWVWIRDDGYTLVLGAPDDSYVFYTLQFPIDRLLAYPLYVLAVLFVDALILFCMYAVARRRAQRAVKPVTEALDALSRGQSAEVTLGGDLAEIGNRLTDVSRIIERKDSARALWIRGVSHDIRTPLSLVVGQADAIARRDDAPADVREQAGAIREQGMKIAALVTDLNTAAQLDYDAKPVQTERVALSRIVRDACARHINEGFDGAFPLTCDIDEAAADAAVLGDERLLTRAAENLLANARSHNPQGCAVRVTLAPAGTGSVSMRVADAGCGATPEQLDAIRARIERAQRTGTVAAAYGEEHGLGLVLVDRIARAHGGTFSVDGSQAGFTATVTLPLAP